VLDRASFDRDQRDSQYRSHIILLTDGMVDVSPADEVNQHERLRIQTQLVPEIAAAGYRIHTLALSEQADHELLQSLARQSDGIYSRVDNADQLLEALVRILHQTVPTDSLPLEGNRFLVDENVDEFTALILRRPGTGSAHLSAPDGAGHSAGRAPEQTNWHSTATYDLITVQNPVAGEWRIDADMQPDSRVTVVSDLRLR